MEELAATAPKPVQQPASAPAVVSAPAPSSKPRFPKRSSTRLKVRYTHHVTFEKVFS